MPFIKGQPSFMKGRHHSTETKIKISLSNKGKCHPNSLKNLGPKNGFKVGYKPTPEHLMNLSISHLGKKAWNKGKSPSIETRQKISQANKGQKRIWPEWRKKAFKIRMSGENNPRWVADRNKIDLNKRRHWSRQCIKWREIVFKRDNYKCKINNEDCCSFVQAHHILPWRSHPELRFSLNNGITLCLVHHPRKRTEEKRLIPRFQELVSVSKDPIF